MTRIREDVAAVRSRPTACHRTYRSIIVRRTIAVAGGQARLRGEVRDRSSLSNDREAAARGLVFPANDRRHQEGLIAPLKGGAPAPRAAVDDLVGPGASMVMTGRAWDLKAWSAPMVPEHPRPKGRHREPERRPLGMGSRRSIDPIIPRPCPIVRGGRRLVDRRLSWDEWRGVFPRAVQAWRR